jgi:hypothetical protein
MPILRLFGGKPSVFDPEEVLVLRDAYEDAFEMLALHGFDTDRDYLARDILRLAESHLSRGGSLRSIEDAQQISMLAVRPLFGIKTA